MSVHIGAKKGEIAETVLLPGDPLRAKHIAETYFNNIECYNEVRGMYGFTGEYNGKRVSVQGTGMGIPSTAIYVNELIQSYGAKKLIRVGSCGSMQKDIKIRDIILAMSASTNSSMNKNIFHGMDYAPTADFELLYKAYNIAKDMKIKPKIGNVFTSDVFYNDNPDEWKLWAKYNALAVEMETTALYTIAAKLGVQALTILTVSDSLVTHEETTADERQKTFNQMIEIALNTAV